MIVQVSQQIGTTGKLSASFGATYELDTYETRMHANTNISG